MASTWFNSPVAGFPAQYTLCADEKAFTRCLKQQNIPARKWPSLKLGGAHAAVYKLKSLEGFYCFIVFLDTTARCSLEVLYSVLVHEATHIKQWYLKLMGEKHPGDEVEAYMVQEISFNLMQEYQKIKGG